MSVCVLLLFSLRLKGRLVMVLSHPMNAGIVMVGQRKAMRTTKEVKQRALSGQHRTIPA